METLKGDAAIEKELKEQERRSASRKRSRKGSKVGKKENHDGHEHA